MIKFKYRKNKNDNDCWNDALSYASGKTYEEIRETFKPLIGLDGSLRHGYINTYLVVLNYHEINIENYTINDVMTYFNHYNCEIVLQLEEHVIYAHKNTIYEYVEPINRVEYLNQKVLKIYLRTKT